MRHENNFDAVRLFAAVLVLVTHQFALTGLPEPSILGLTPGGYGVCIFFSISGYLVAQSWSRAASPLVFVVHRMRRIWPAFAVVVLATAFVLGPAVSTFGLREYLSQPELPTYLRVLFFDMHYALPGVFAFNPFPVAVNGSLWTIPLELTWYAILAGLGLVGVLRRTPLMTAASALVVAFVLQQSYTGKPGLAPPWLLFGACFMIGATFSRLRTRLLAHRRRWMACGILVGLLCASWGIWYGMVYAIVPVAAILAGEARTPWIHAAGRHGDFSYGFYLYAFPVQQTLVWASDNRLPFLIGLLLSAAITLACAVVSWNVIERPALRWGRHRARGRTPASNGAVAGGRP